jgi:hypothetical protein
MKRSIALVVLVAAVTVSLVAQSAREATITIKAAVTAETIEQDLTKAIALYERALKEAGADRTLSAQILLDAPPTRERRTNASFATTRTLASLRGRRRPRCGGFRRPAWAKRRHPSDRSDPRLSTRVRVSTRMSRQTALWRLSWGEQATSPIASSNET